MSGDNGKISVTTATVVYVLGSCHRQNLRHDSNCCLRPWFVSPSKSPSRQQLLSTSLVRVTVKISVTTATVVYVLGSCHCQNLRHYSNCCLRPWFVSPSKSPSRQQLLSTSLVRVTVKISVTTATVVYVLGSCHRQNLRHDSNCCLRPWFVSLSKSPSRQQLLSTSLVRVTVKISVTTATVVYVLGSCHCQNLRHYSNCCLRPWFVSPSFSTYRRDAHPLETDTKERHSLSLTFLETGHPTEIGRPTYLIYGR